MTQLDEDDLRRVVASLPERLGTALREHDAYVAGGYIRALIAREPPADVDVFVPSSDAADALVAELDIEPAHVTEFARTLLIRRRMVQVIHRYTFATPEEVLRRFDFTVSQAVVWFDGEGWRGACSADFYPDLVARRISYTVGARTPPESVGTLARLMKYTAKGYSASPETVTRIVEDAVDSSTPWCPWTPPWWPDWQAVMLDAWRGIDPVATRPWL